MSKVLLVDTNVSSSPIYDYLLNSGNEVYVVGGNPNDFLAKTAKNYIQMDYSDVAALVALIDKLEIDFIVPGCNDLSYKVCAEISEVHSFYGIDSLDVTETINSKEKFRKFAIDNGLTVPKVYDVHESLSSGASVIVKPVDAFSGRGMTIVNSADREQLNIALEKANSFSRSKSCLIEEYVTGQLYSHSAFIVGDEIVVDFIVEEHGTANPFVVDTSRVIFDYPLELLSRIRADVLKLAKVLKLKDGLIHTQFIQNQDKLWLIEITRRCPGDLYSLLIEYSTGIRYAEMYARPFVDKTAKACEGTAKQRWVMRHTVSQPLDGYWQSLQLNYPVKIQRYVSLALAGDLIKSSPFGRIALVFTESESKSELEFIFSETLKRKLYSIH